VDLVSKAREAGVEQIGLMVDRQEDRGRELWEWAEAF